MGLDGRLSQDTPPGPAVSFFSRAFAAALTLLVAAGTFGCVSEKQRVLDAQNQIQQAHLAEQVKALGSCQELPPGTFYGAFAPDMGRAVAVGQSAGRQLARAEITGAECVLHFFNGERARLQQAEFDPGKMLLPPIAPVAPRDSTAFYAGQFDDGAPLHLQCAINDHGRMGSVYLIPDGERPISGYLMPAGSMKEQVVSGRAAAMGLGPAGSVAGLVKWPEFDDLALSDSEVLAAVQDLAIKRHEQGPYYLLDIQRFDVSASAPNFARIESGRGGIPLRVELFFPHGSQGLAASHGMYGHRYEQPARRDHGNLLVVNGGFSADLLQLEASVRESAPTSVYAMVYSPLVTAIGPLRTTQEVYNDTLAPVVRKLVKTQMLRLLARSLAPK